MLTKEAEPQHANDLSHKALGLIKRLARELEYLACEAERCPQKVPLGLDCPRKWN
jgi:hypothetical protein